MVDFFSRKAKAAREVARTFGMRAVVRSDSTVKIQARGDQHIGHMDATPIKFEGRFVTFVPRSVAEQITDDVILISIRSRYDSWPDFKSKGPILRLTFDTNAEYGNKLFDAEDFALVDTFLQQNPDKNIVIHCTEARMRSPALAWAISNCYEGIKMFKEYPGCPGSTATACRATRSAFIECYHRAAKVEG